ncbi:MAG: hypothetical protein L6427_11735 [Actinomycetia bacterium]|nr:hypothetical protein [Actinomycetes bacterium]
MVDDKRERTVRRVTRAVVVLVAAGIVVVLAYLHAAPFGAKVVLDFGFDGESRNVRMLEPFTYSTALGTDENGVVYEIPQLKMTTDEVTFDVRVPYQSFDRLEAKIKFRGDPDELLIGILGKTNSEYEFMPVNNRSLNQLNWDKIEGGDCTLFQREREFETVDGFLRAVPSISQESPYRVFPYSISTYYYQLSQPKPDINPARANEPLRIDATLRGPHSFYTYTTGGRPTLSLTKQDINISQGGDPLVVHFLKGDEVVHSWEILDDGDTSASIVPGKPQRITMTAPLSEKGVYRIVFDCSEDVLISDISFSENYLCVYERVFLANHDIYMVGPTKGTTLYTNAQRFTALMWHPQFCQMIEVDGERSVLLKEGSTAVSEQLEGDLSTIKTEMGDVVIEVPESCLAFSRDSFFDPFPLKTLEYDKSTDLGGVEYIITSYTIPEKVGESFAKTVSMSARDIIPSDGKLRFMISAPNLARAHGEVVIESLELTLIKD